MEAFPFRIALPVPQSLVEKIWRSILPPVVEFGSPVQRAKRERPYESFWHIPVSLRPKWRIGPASLSNGIFYLDEYERGERVNAIQLMAGDAGLTGVTSPVQVTSDHVCLVPVAWRSESGEDRNGYIADTRFFEQRVFAYPVAPDRKKHRYVLRLKCGGKDYESPHFYLLRVPEITSNGHFTLEIEYEGEGSQ